MTTPALNTGRPASGADGSARLGVYYPPAGGVPPAATAEQAGGMDARTILNRLRYHWFTCLVLGSLLAGPAAAAVWYLMPVKYGTYALLQVSSQPINTKGEDSDVYDRNSFITYLKTQAQLLKSHFVLQSAMRADYGKIGKLTTLKRVDDPIGFLEQELRVEFTEGTEVIKLALDGDVADDLTYIVDAVQNAYLREVVEEARKNKQNQLTLIEQTKQKLEDKTRNKQKMLEDLRKNVEGTGEAAMTPKERMNWARFNQLTADHARAQGETAVAQKKVESLDARLRQADKLDGGDEVKAAVEADPTLHALMAKAEVAKQRHKYLDQITADKTAGKFVASAKAVETARQAAEDHKAKLVKDLTESRRNRLRAELTAQADTAREEAAGFADREARVKQQLDDLGAKLDKARADTPLADMIAYQHEINVNQAEIAEKSKQASNLRFELESRPRVTALQPSMPPARRDIKKQIMMSVAAGLGAFALVAGGLCLFEGRAARVFGSADLKAKSSLPLLGCVPEVEPAGKGRSAAARQQASYEEFSEAVDRIRAVAIPGGPADPTRLVLVASASGREGATTLASHLALSLVKLDKKVLLVDANFRSPGLHKSLDLPAGPGLAELLRGEASQQAVVQRTAINGLHFVPAGLADPEARESLGKLKAKQILEKFRAEFDYVVVDAHPVLGATETLLLSPLADAIFLAVLKHRTSLTRLDQAHQRLVGVGARNLGTVLMGE